LLLIHCTVLLWATLEHTYATMFVYTNI
jgi:hypothetical protein